MGMKAVNRVRWEGGGHWAGLLDSGRFRDQSGWSCVVNWAWIYGIENLAAMDLVN